MALEADKGSRGYSSAAEEIFETGGALVEGPDGFSAYAYERVLVGDHLARWQSFLYDRDVSTGVLEGVRAMPSKRSLGYGIGGLHTRVARAVNRVMGRRGSVFVERFHSRVLGTPREVWAAIRYVLGNARKHGQVRQSAAIDPASSGRWFGPWKAWWNGAVDRPAVASPRYWLTRVGWRRRGEISPWDVPGEARAG